MDALDHTLITGDNLGSFAPLIPDSLYGEIKNGRLFAIGSVLLDYPNGALVFSLDEDTATIYSIYVDRYDRRSGTGAFLMGRLCGLLSQMPGIYSLRAVLPADAEETGAAPFFRAMEFECSDYGGAEAAFTLESLHNIPLPPAAGNLSFCLPGDKLTSEARLSFQRKLAASGSYLMEKSLNDPSILQAVSKYYVQNGEIRGCIIFSSEEPGKVVFDFVYANQGASEFLPLFISALKSLRESFPPQTAIRLQTVNEASYRLLKKLVPSAALLYRKLAVRPIL